MLVFPYAKSFRSRSHSIGGKFLGQTLFLGVASSNSTWIASNGKIAMKRDLGFIIEHLQERAYEATSLVHEPIETSHELQGD